MVIVLHIASTIACEGLVLCITLCMCEGLIGHCMMSRVIKWFDCLISYSVPTTCI